MVNATSTKIVNEIERVLYREIFIDEYIKDEYRYFSFLQQQVNILKYLNL